MLACTGLWPDIVVDSSAGGIGFDIGAGTLLLLISIALNRKHRARSEGKGRALAVSSIHTKDQCI